MSNRDNGKEDEGLGVGGAGVAEALEELDDKVARVTVIERKLAEIDELEKRVARLKELEYELAAQPDEPDEPDTTNNTERPRPYRLHRPTAVVVDDSEKPEDRGIILREYRRVMYQFSFIGIELGVAVALGALGGRWLDKQWDTAPWMMLLGVALGLTAAGRDLYRLVKRAQKKSAEGADLHSARDAAEGTPPDAPADKNGHSS